MGETKEQLQEQLGAVRAKLSRIEGAERREQNRALIGKCFKYPKNCYSMPEKPSDYWPVYYKVTGLSRYGVKAFVFQTDSRGRIEIKTETDFMEHSDVVPISEREYQRAWKRVQQRVAKEKP